MAGLAKWVVCLSKFSGLMGVLLIEMQCNSSTCSSEDVMLLLFTRPLPRDGGMAEDHGAPEAEQLPRVWTRGGKEKESRQRVSGAKSP